MKHTELIVQHINAVQGKSVLVIGDVMLDRYVIGHVQRISPEAPIPVLSHSQSSQATGGAANVARNLAQLGCQVTLVGCVGQDPVAVELIDTLSQIPQLSFCPVSCADRRTTVKTRYLSSGQQMLRVDSETTEPITTQQAEQIVSQAETLIEQAEVLVLSDYAKGCLFSDINHRLIKLAEANDVPVIVDPKSHDFSVYKGATMLTPNLAELSRACGAALYELEEIEAAARTQMKQNDIKKMLVTLSARGMLLVEPDHAVHLPAYPCDVYDVSGAGDTVLALMTSAKMTGLDDEAGIQLANLGASLVVAKTGTASLTPGELIVASSTKAVDATLATTKLNVTQWRDKGKTIGFTNGCFDLLHPGHIHLLSQAAAHCDHLIVGLNSDTSVKQLKGSNRPIQQEQDRARSLAALPYVSAVVLFAEDTPQTLIETLSPDILIKGGDYVAEHVVGYQHVTQTGGQVVIIDTLPGHSTTGFLKTGSLKLY